MKWGNNVGDLTPGRRRPVKSTIQYGNRERDKRRAIQEIEMRECCEKRGRGRVGRRETSDEGLVARLHPLVTSHPWALLDLLPAVHISATVIVVHLYCAPPPLVVHHVWRCVDAHGV